MINNLAKYTRKWDLNINLSKSKIIVFRNRGRTSIKEKWNIEGKSEEVVNRYKHLGVTLSPQLKFTDHLNKRINPQ